MTTRSGSMPSFSGGVIDDAHVRLVRDVDVDVVDRGAAFRQNGLRRCHEHACGELEHLAAVHHDVVRTVGHRLGRRRLPRAAGGQRQVGSARTVGAELEAEEAALGHTLHHNRAGAVAEEDAGRAVAPVHEFREHVAADDERLLRQPGRDHAVRLGDRVHEAGTPGGEVVGGRVPGAEPVGEQGAGGRERHVRSDRRDDQQVDVLRRGCPTSRAPARRREARRPTAPPPARRCVAPGCPCARRSTRRRCRPASTARRSSAPCSGT